MGIGRHMNMQAAQPERPAQVAAPLNVHPADIELSADGISGFSWPYNHKEILAFGNALEHGLAELLANHPDQKAAIAYKIAAKNYVLSISACFMGEILRDRLQKSGQTLNLPQDWQIWRSLLNDLAPPEPFYIGQIKLNAKKDVGAATNLQHSFLRILKLLKRAGFGSRGVKFDGLYLPRFSIKPEKDAIWATQRLPLIREHAVKVRAPVYLCSSQAFFSCVSDAEVGAAIQTDELHYSVIEVIRKTYQDYGIQLRAHIEAYLDDILKRYIALIRVHLARLSFRSDLPVHLWTGTGGNLWDVILRCAVRERGGDVIAHDHGGGVPHLDHPEKGWIEMWSCNRFVTYSDEQVRTFEQFMHGWPNLDKDLPVVEALERGAGKSALIHEFPRFKNGGAIKSVRIFSTIYSSEDGRGLPIYPHMAYIDWQARLIGHLKARGYDVTFKPHPDSRLSPPRSYENRLGAKIIEAPFDPMDQDFDLYIFDLSNTSVLQAALLTNKPVLVVDFSVMNWREDAKTLFKRRCGYILGYYEGNRMMIDWTQLDPQIKKAAERCNDHAFAKKYYF
jgi:hypothetical protein